MSAGPAYGAGTIKRERRTAVRVEQLDQQILEVLRQDHPQSVRHVFYRMTDPRLQEPVEKSERGYRHVQNRCKELRRCGRVPYGWISDASRRGYLVNTFQDGADFVRRMAGLYRANLWADADYYVEVWCESRSIAGVIEDDCNDLAVNLYPCGGFSSITLAYEAAKHINAVYDLREVVIFYIGDYDQSGVLIDVALERELRRHLDIDGELEFNRLGITPEQITRYDLPTKPRKETDRRSAQVKFTVEAEAMPASILRRLLRSQVEARLPERALDVAKIAEQSERDGLRRVADIMQGRA